MDALDLLTWAAKHADAVFAIAIVTCGLAVVSKVLQAFAGRGSTSHKTRP
jgi:hypothetical protein